MGNRIFYPVPHFHTRKGFKLLSVLRENLVRFSATTRYLAIYYRVCPGLNSILKEEIYARANER